MSQSLVLMIWTCLTLSVRGKNPIFDQIFPSTSVLAELVSSCSLVCCPGLLDILREQAPPLLAQLKSLPTNFYKRWAVYLLVLEKPSCTPKVYVGSGTAAQSGVSQRMSQYDGLSLLPRYVAEALNDGYTITHKGLLLWAPIPSTKDVPLVRALFLLLEASMTFTFWAVKSKNDGTFYAFGDRSLCRWDVDNLPYTGLCSHNPLNEGPSLDNSLSPEDLEELQKARRRNEASRKLVPNQQNFAKNIADKRFYCDICNYPAAHGTNYDNHLMSKRHLNKVAGRVSTKGTKRKDRVSTIAKKKYYCTVCDYSAVHKQNLDTHLNSKKHLDKVLLVPSGTS